MKRQDGFPAKRIGRLFLLVAVAFYAGAVWILISGLLILMWPSTNASVIAASIDRFPAADGSLLFRTKLHVSYFVDGKEISAEAVSAKFTDSFADAKRELRRFEPGSTETIRYNRQNLKDARFDIGLSWSYLGSVPLLVALGSIIGFLGWVIYRSHKPPVFCPQCNQRLQHHFRFCTACAAPVATAPAAKNV